MKSKALLLTLAVAALGALLYVLLRQPAARDDAVGLDGGAGQGRAVIPRGGQDGGAVAPIRRPRLDASGGRVAAGKVADAATVGNEIGVPVSTRPPSKAGIPARLAFEAKRSQAAMVRVELTAVRERAETLTKILASLKSSGKATPEQLLSIQTQIQQSTDAEPRLRRQLEKLDAEIADELQHEKKAQPPHE